MKAEAEESCRYKSMTTRFGVCPAAAWGSQRLKKAERLFQAGVLQISATGLFLKHGEDEVCAVVSRALILLGAVYRPYGSRPYTLTNPLRNPKDRKQLALLEVPRIEIKIWSKTLKSFALLKQYKDPRSRACEILPLPKINGGSREFQVNVSVPPLP